MSSENFKDDISFAFREVNQLTIGEILNSITHHRDAAMKHSAFLYGIFLLRKHASMTWEEACMWCLLNGGMAAGGEYDKEEIFPKLLLGAISKYGIDIQLETLIADSKEFAKEMEGFSVVEGKGEASNVLSEDAFKNMWDNASDRKQLFQGITLYREKLIDAQERLLRKNWEAWGCFEYGETCYRIPAECSGTAIETAGLQFPDQYYVL